MKQYYIERATENRKLADGWLAKAIAEEDEGPRQERFLTMAERAEVRAVDCDEKAAAAPF